MGRCSVPLRHLHVEQHGTFCKVLELQLKYLVWAILCRSDVLYCQSTKMSTVLWIHHSFRAESNELYVAFSISAQFCITPNNISHSFTWAFWHSLFKGCSIYVFCILPYLFFYCTFCLLQYVFRKKYCVLLYVLHSILEVLPSTIRAFKNIVFKHTVGTVTLLVVS